MTWPTLVVNGGLLFVAVTSACSAHADPPRFPDLGGYSPVDAAEYAVDAPTPGMPSTQVYFRTPDGVACNFLSGWLSTPVISRIRE